jgi:hypothetical protein
LAVHINATAQNIVIVTGVLVDSISQKPLDKATLIRLSDNRPFITDRSGTFEITCTDNDAIRISYVGYVTMRLVVRNIPDSALNNKKYLRIEMRRDLGQLPQIVINENPLQKSNIQDSIYYAYALKPMEASIMNPISFLYAQFSKSEKEKAKLNEILQQKYFDDILNYRLPKQLLLNITGDKTFSMELLKQKCRPNEFFILNASDYELYQWVKRCYDD